MATIRCWALHGNINNAISYVLDVKNDGSKTENKYFECSCGNAYSAAYLWKINSDKEVSRNKIVGFHFQQSFEPGSIAPDEAYEISKKWIEKILGNEYDYVLALHTDTKHIHSHIIVNPISKKTGKHLEIFYKRDLPKYKMLSDQICKENGLRIIEQNQGDSFKQIISKTLDSLIERVSSYDELKQYIEKLGFSVEDDLNNQDQDNDKSFYTIDRKMIENETENAFKIRLPYTQLYMNVLKEDVSWLKNNKTLLLSIQDDQQISLIDKAEHFVKEITGADLSLNLEKKDLKKKRSGLRIKPPSANKFIRCSRITNEFGQGYSLDEVLERIENNGRLVCDPEIKRVIEADLNDEMKKNEKSKFYEQANIKNKWKNSNYYKSSKKERYIEWRTKQIQEKINSIHQIKEMFKNVNSLNSLKDELKELKKEYRNLNDDIRKQESTLEEIEQLKMEDLLDINDSEVDEFIEENITPLYKSKKDLYQKMQELEKTIKQTEKFKEKNNLEL